MINGRSAIENKITGIKSVFEILESDKTVNASSIRKYYCLNYIFQIV